MQSSQVYQAKLFHSTHQPAMDQDDGLLFKTSKFWWRPKACSGLLRADDDDDTPFSFAS